MVATRFAGAAVTYIDSTALTEWERAPWLRFAARHNCPVEAIYFEVPLEECLRRNALRDRVVPEEILRRMSARLVMPATAEGFTKVTTLRP